jgi:hypothetical protein
MAASQLLRDKIASLEALYVESFAVNLTLIGGEEEILLLFLRMCDDPTYFFPKNPPPSDEKGHFNSSVLQNIFTG